jgi:hypothetical protein
MKKSLAVFFSGLAVSLLAAYASRGIRRQRREAGLGLVDLNSCSVRDLNGLGLEDSTIERIVESRPYRSKLELVSRVMLPNDVYAAIKNRVNVANTNEPIKFAS